MQRQNQYEQLSNMLDIHTTSTLDRKFSMEARVNRGMKNLANVATPMGLPSGHSDTIL